MKVCKGPSAGSGPGFAEGSDASWDIDVPEKDGAQDLEKTDLGVIKYTP